MLGGLLMWNPLGYYSRRRRSGPLKKGSNDSRVEVTLTHQHRNVTGLLRKQSDHNLPPLSTFLRVEQVEVPRWQFRVACWIVPVLFTQYCAGDEIEKNEMGGACGTMEDERVVYKVLVGKPEGKRPLGRPRRRWEDNIKMDLQEVGRGCVDWMELAQDRDGWRALVSSVMNFRVP